MKQRIFRHKETYKEYELIQERILFKDYKSIEDGNEKLNWRGKDSETLVLYKALYDNPDGPFFVRHLKDFNKNFTEIVPVNREVFKELEIGDILTNKKNVKLSSGEETVVGYNYKVTAIDKSNPLYPVTIKNLTMGVVYVLTLDNIDECLNLKKLVCKPDNK